jgi:hypothetical protein
MKQKPHRFIWIPRALMILYAAFLLLFSFDVFDSSPVTALQIQAFLIHSIPTFIILILLGVSWRAPVLAGILFFAVTCTVTFFFQTYQSIVLVSMLSLPPLIGAILFWISASKQKRASRT